MENKFITMPSTNGKSVIINVEKILYLDEHGQDKKTTIVVFGPDVTAAVSLPLFETAKKLGIQPV